MRIRAKQELLYWYGTGTWLDISSNILQIKKRHNKKVTFGDFNPNLLKAIFSLKPFIPLSVPKNKKNL